MQQTANRTAQSRLKTYLMDTFDRAFGYPKHQPWTLCDLQVRLEVLHNLLVPGKIYNSCSAVFQDLALMSGNRTTNTAHSSLLDHGRNAFETAARVITEAKRAFVAKNPNHYRWSSGDCAWIDASTATSVQCQHNDILIYASLINGRLVDEHLMITFFAQLSENHRMITISIGTTCFGKDVRIPVVYQGEGEDYSNTFQERFETEFKSLLVAIKKERESRLQTPARNKNNSDS